MGTELVIDPCLIQEEIDDLLQRFVRWIEAGIKLDPELSRRLRQLSTCMVYGVDDLVKPESVTPEIDAALQRRFNELCELYQLESLDIELPGSRLALTRLTPA